MRKVKKKRTLRPKRDCPDCHKVLKYLTDAQIELAQAACEKERLEAQERSDRAYQDILAAKCDARLTEIDDRDAMLDVMAKALEKASWLFSMMLDEAKRVTEMNNSQAIQLARKASVIKQYERAWGKGQPEPCMVLWAFTNIRCSLPAGHSEPHSWPGVLGGCAK